MVTIRGTEAEQVLVSVQPPDLIGINFCVSVEMINSRSSWPQRQP